MFRAFDCIDPVNMTAEESRYLGRLLLQIHAETGEVYFPAGYSTHHLNGRNGDETVSLNLRYPIVIRRRIHHSDQLRLEVIGKEIGSGGFSHVYKIMHTLIPQSDGSLIGKDKQRILKLQVERPNAYVTAEKEYQQASLISHLHVKKPVYSTQSGSKSSYMIGGYMLGSSLENFLRHDARARQFSLDDRLRLSIELIRTLREQVHQKGIVHRDVKPGNIIVNVKSGKSPQAFHIDFGLSKSVNVEDRTKCGTYRYFAPETWRGENATLKSDIYSLGIVLSQLWEAPSTGMFTNIQGLSEEQEIKLKQAIKKMCANLPKDRGTLEEVEAVFNEVRFECSLSLEDQKCRDELEKVHAIARHLHQQIIQYCQSNKGKWNINVIRREVEKTMLGFPDKPQFVREFISELGIRALDDLTDKQSVCNKFKSITAEYVFVREDLKAAIHALKQMVSAGLPMVEGDYQDYLKDTLKNSERRSALLPVSIDDVVAITKKCLHDTDKIKKEIEFIHHSRISSGVAQAPVRPLTTPNLSGRYQGFFLAPPLRKDIPRVTDAWDLPQQSLLTPSLRH